MIAQSDVPISQLTSFKNVGTIDTVLRFLDESELADYITQNTTYEVLGKGSNSVLSPQLTVPVIQIDPGFCDPTVTQTRLCCSAGTSTHQLLTFAKDAGLSGLEFTAGVPASVGGMVAMNFGCWGQQVSDMIHRVYVMKPDGTTTWLSNAECQFEYRQSLFHTTPWIVLKAEFNLQQLDPDQIGDRIKKVVRERIDKQPLKQATFGSIFKNPYPHHAGQLIEEAGLKGLREGALQISEKHANFLVNLGEATYSQTRAFTDKIQTTVATKTGIQLEYEVHWVQ